MDVYLDEERLAINPTTLAEVIEHVRQRIADGDRVIVEVRMDGQSLTEEQLDACEQQPLECDEVQLVTADPYELARQTLEQIREALLQVKDAQQEAANLLQSDQAAEAMEHVRDLLQVWQQAQQSVLHSAQLLGLSLDEIRVGERDLPQIVDQLSTALGDIRQQLSARDWIGLADTLAYPLDEAADAWCAMIDVLCEQIDDRQS
jgi:septation ring formation regulator EzrA